MSPKRVWWWIGIVVMLVLAAPAYAQEATIGGAITDSTGATLPGVTVRAVNTATGNNFEGVTDGRGGYQLSVRVGTYKLTAELSGFAIVSRTLTLLVGQEAAVNLQLALSSVQETVTVSARAPLIDVTQSSLGGNIDSKQLQELPVNGRNWLSLVALAPGARTNAVSEAPSNAGAVGPSGSRVGGDFELNVDGQQLTQLVSGSPTDPQARFSRDAIPEFEFLSTRFDATQGRSTGFQVNVITKSGTDRYSGTYRRLLPRRPAECSRLRRQARAAVLGPAVERDVRRSDREGQGALLR